MTAPGGQRPFVPREFAVPRELVTAEFRLEPLGPQHNARDYEAWTSSMEHIRGTPGFAGWSWPKEMTPEQNLGDLRRHADDFARRAGEHRVGEPGPGDRVVGCVYIYPAKEGEPGAGDVHSWVRADRAELDVPLHDAVSAWLAGAWPFTVIHYAPRPAGSGEAANAGA